MEFTHDFVLKNENINGNFFLKEVFPMDDRQNNTSYYILHTLTYAHQFNTLSIQTHMSVLHCITVHYRHYSEPVNTQNVHYSLWDTVFTHLNSNLCFIVCFLWQIRSRVGEEISTLSFTSVVYHCVQGPFCPTIKYP